MPRLTAVRICLGTTLVALASLLFVTSCASTKEKPAAPKPPPVVTEAVTPAKAELKITDLWTDPEDLPLSSVVWSPKGDRIAFVTASGSAGEDDVHHADILVLSLPEGGRRAKATKLISLPRSEGIPAALFWLDDNRIGWAAAQYRAHTFDFVQMRLSGGKPTRLVNQRFIGVQNRLSMEYAFGGPDDVWYDAASHTLIFSGGATPTGVYVKILPLSIGKVRKLNVPGVDGAGPVTLCGSLQDPEEPEFFVAAVVDKPAFGWPIWRSNSYALSRDEVFVTSPDRHLEFPRVSPDGKKLVYLSIQGETGLSEIMLCDLESGVQRRLVTLASQWEAGFYPAMGCPFSWSPDSRRIAYADRPKIRIVQIPPMGSRSK